MTRVVPQVVLLKSIELEQPLDIRSLYNAAHQGRIPWLSHISPEGRHTRSWWVDVPGMLSYFRARGIELDLRVSNRSEEFRRSAATA